MDLSACAYYLVVDLEATCCDRQSIPAREMESIEIGAVMVDAASLTVVGQFQSFIRPVKHPMLTDFCRSLTSIQQKDVDDAPGFVEVMTAFRDWFRGWNGVAFLSWGNFDRSQLVQDCQLHGISYPMPTHGNLKALFATKHQLEKRPSMLEALARVGLTMQGTVHRGIDDAHNTARLLPWIVGNERLP